MRHGKAIALIRPRQAWRGIYGTMMIWLMAHLGRFPGRPSVCKNQLSVAGCSLEGGNLGDLPYLAAKMGTADAAVPI